jgi:choice-of-anchor A domain-containing protein
VNASLSAWPRVLALSVALANHTRTGVVFRGGNTLYLNGDEQPQLEVMNVPASVLAAVSRAEPVCVLPNVTVVVVVNVLGTAVTLNSAVQNGVRAHGAKWVLWNLPETHSR